MTTSPTKTPDQAKAEGVALALMMYEMAIQNALDSVADPLKPGLLHALQLTSALQALPIADRVIVNMRNAP